MQPRHEHATPVPHTEDDTARKGREERRWHLEVLLLCYILRAVTSHCDSYTAQDRGQWVLHASVSPVHLTARLSILRIKGGLLKSRKIYWDLIGKGSGAQEHKLMESGAQSKELPLTVAGHRVSPLGAASMTNRMTQSTLMF